MSRRDKDYLSDIQDAIQRILAYTEGLSYEQFLADRKTQDAVIRNLQVIGEAVKKLSASIRKAHARVPWKTMAGMRDRIVHEYFGINCDVVWTVARQELPRLVPEIESLSGQLEE